VGPVALVFVFLFVDLSESVIIGREMHENAKNANQNLIVFLNQDLQRKNACAGEMSLLPLLNLWFAFKLIHFVSVVLFV